jgi:beta propeller repeat protein
MNHQRVLSALLAITFLVVGCKPESSARGTVSNTPAPQQALQLSEPVKVQVTEPTINLERLGQSTLAGNILVATTNISGTSRPISIDLGNGQIEGLQSPLRLISTETPSVHYILRLTSYTKDRRSFGELFVYDLQRSQEVQIANNLPTVTAVSGNVVVWQGSGEGGWNIYGYDMSTGQTFTVTHGAGIRAYPRTAGDWVIYIDMTQEAALHAYLIKTGEDLVLGQIADPKYDSYKRGRYHLVSKDKIIWADADTYRLHVFDLNTRTTEILPETLTRCQPLYWLESMVGHTLLYAGCDGWALYDLDSKASVTIPIFPAEVRARMTQTPNEDAIYTMGWIVMSDTRLAWTVIDGLGHSWLYTARIER